MTAAVEHGADQRSFTTRFYLMPIGRPLGGKKGMKVELCPKCQRPSWKKSAREYVHETITKLNAKLEPEIERLQGCDLDKYEAECVLGGRPLPKKGERRK